MDIAPADLTHVRELYAQGRYRRAYDAAVALGPLRAWSGTAARLIGGRLAIQLAAPKLGRRMHLAAFRATPGHPEAIYYHARYRTERFGPLSAWRFMRDHPDWSDAPPELHADWIALSGFVAARLRDFDRAERLLNRAEAISPDRPWPCIERSSAYEFADPRIDRGAGMPAELVGRPGDVEAPHLSLGADQSRVRVHVGLPVVDADRGFQLSVRSSLRQSARRGGGHGRDLDVDLVCAASLPAPAIRV